MRTESDSELDPDGSDLSLHETSIPRERTLRTSNWIQFIHMLLIKVQVKRNLFSVCSRFDI